MKSAKIPAHGDWRRLAALLASGVLWEFWNYWAATKWTYTVPYLGDVKILRCLCSATWASRPLPSNAGRSTFSAARCSVRVHASLMPERFGFRRLMLKSKHRTLEQ